MYKSIIIVPFAFIANVALRIYAYKKKIPLN